jgi:two-component system, OmpR family, lantibiotic biosynthesis sensor histidine kinase NisK/SpaK
MEQLKQLSLKKTIMLYLLIALTVSFFASAIIISTTQRIQDNVWLNYIDKDKYYDMVIQTEEEYGVQIKTPRPGSYVMSNIDYHISEACDFIETWTPLILTTLGAGLAVLIFYKNKLKVPIKILEEGSQEIARNNLDFQISYDLQDEMGRLCSSFEHMRGQLLINNKYLWKMIEEQKNLKAAITHDLRAPLAILKGYHEMLIEFIPQDKFDKERLSEIIVSCDKQTDRLTLFIDKMRQMSSLEDRNTEYEAIITAEFIKQLKTTAVILAGPKNIVINILEEPQEPLSFWADRALIYEVYENLVSNAVRYATRKIVISIVFINSILQIQVCDDGVGFQEDNIDLVTKAYYHDNPPDDMGHFGLGLYISKLLCEKHGGKVRIENDINTGASVKAEFNIRV